MGSHKKRWYPYHERMAITAVIEWKIIYHGRAHRTSSAETRRILRDKKISLYCTRKRMFVEVSTAYDGMRNF